MHPLLARARDLSRRIYASLPWGYRVAGLMLRLASSLTDSVGRAVYAEFAKRGVVDMPPINGEPPPRNLKTAPAGYGKRFGERLYATLLAKSRRPDSVEEAMAVTLTQIAEGKLSSLREGAHINEAEQYVIRMALNNLRLSWRKEKGRGRDPIVKEDIDLHINLDDPNSFKSLDTMLPKNELTKLLRDLEKVHERAPSWLEARLDGLSSVELAQEWGVGKSSVTGWEQKYVPRIQQIVTRYLQEAA